jgi:hypothetical protein
MDIIGTLLLRVTMRTIPARLPVALRDHLDRLRIDLLDPANTTLRKQFQLRYDEGFDQSRSAAKKATKVSKAGSRRQPSSAGIHNHP